MPPLVDDNLNEISEESIDETYIPTKFERPTPGFHGVTNRHIEGMQMLEQAWTLILRGLERAYDLNLNDENFRETPKRIAKMMILERCSGINSEDACKKLLDKSFPTMKNKNLDDQLIVTTSPALVYGICPHHFENVRYCVWTGYIPKNKLIGISKFSRVVDLYAKQPILQESYTSGLADIFVSALDPKGVIVVVKGSHDCMLARGTKSNPNQFMITSAMRGIFADPGMETYKEEFFTLCRSTGL